MEARISCKKGKEKNRKSRITLHYIVQLNQILQHIYKTNLPHYGQIFTPIAIKLEFKTRLYRPSVLITGSKPEGRREEREEEAGAPNRGESNSGQCESKNPFQQSLSLPPPPSSPHRSPARIYRMGHRSTV